MDTRNLVREFKKENKTMLRRFGIRNNEKIVSSRWLGEGRNRFIPVARHERVVYGPSHVAVIVRRKTWRERLGI